MFLEPLQLKKDEEGLEFLTISEAKWSKTWQENTSWFRHCSCGKNESLPNGYNKQAQDHIPTSELHITLNRGTLSGTSERQKRSGVASALSYTLDIRAVGAADAISVIHQDTRPKLCRT